ncbi:keratin-associated protein 5-5-like [Ammospiza caudacuta]|uniref:keratin-associated protein 5-5-like n=1 Tax=Ammospiza caudacuta TaxID=2857398 RepID=UPI00273A375A|nr:keratin-associated protein 5-5-like [Ammospiza caudacuta]
MDPKYKPYTYQTRSPPPLHHPTMSCCYSPCCYSPCCYSLCCSPCYRTCTYSCNPCISRILSCCRRSYGSCCTSRSCTTRYCYPSCCTTRCYYPSCCSYSCCYPCC